MKESQFHAYQRKHGKHEKNQSFTSRVTDFFFFFVFPIHCFVFSLFPSVSPSEEKGERECEW